MTANVCDDRCQDAAMHIFYYVKRGNFRWCLPKFNVLHYAELHPGVRLNRYPHNVIGIAFGIGRRGVGMRWKRS